MPALLGFWECVMLQPVANPALHQSASPVRSNTFAFGCMFRCINQLSAIFNDHLQVTFNAPSSMCLQLMQASFKLCAMQN
jgi:hypothetical protein